jgi:hypothetical protein
MKTSTWMLFWIFPSGKCIGIYIVITTVRLEINTVTIVVSWSLANFYTEGWMVQVTEMFTFTQDNVLTCLRYSITESGSIFDGEKFTWE